ncbi:TetR/AcrR family transcriptional regulator [Sphingorhabdus sp. M41]|uniref:TetR/AcrR family transcriptional regulator n=1 Tax=Sphingorhabdus sp. M41 TaxID=1806885 RepID=UPI0012E84FC5|nr:TetR/AcrR family transcriptional regulator [Sphingorhabdus sp. M41]
MHSSSDLRISAENNERPASERVVRNLNGQKLGRKGIITRQRILTAASKLIVETDDLQISLGAIAAEADLGMTSVYNYFSDLTDVILGVLEHIMVDAEEAYLAHLRIRWEDENLAEECSKFINAFFIFWTRNANVFHIRNNFADKRDRKMIAHRASVAQEILGLIIAQMAKKSESSEYPHNSMASAVYMGIERAVSVLNNKLLMNDLPTAYRPDKTGLLAAEARLFEFGIRSERGVQW